MPTDHSSTVFAAGGENHDDYSDCPFRVDKHGNLYATSAEIKGKVTATSGSFKGSVYASGGNIGNWEITSSGLHSVYYNSDDGYSYEIYITPEELRVRKKSGGVWDTWESLNWYTLANTYRIL